MKHLEQVGNYYSDRIGRFGPTARGVDWNEKESQLARFTRFNQLFERVPGPLSLIDYGCGYGELYGFLTSRFEINSYAGVDVSPAMLEAARSVFCDDAKVVLTENLSAVAPAACVVASGTYNVKLTASSSDWFNYVVDDLKACWGKTTFGMAVNFLSEFSEVGKRQDKLFYASPQKIMSLLLKEFSPLVNLDHSYSPWEFTATIFREA